MQTDKTTRDSYFHCLCPHTRVCTQAFSLSMSEDGGAVEGLHSAAVVAELGSATSSSSSSSSNREIASPVANYAEADVSALSQEISGLHIESVVDGCVQDVGGGCAAGAAGDEVGTAAAAAEQQEELPPPAAPVGSGRRKGKNRPRRRKKAPEQWQEEGGAAGASSPVQPQEGAKSTVPPYYREGANYGRDYGDGAGGGAAAALTAHLQAPPGPSSYLAQQQLQLRVFEQHQQRQFQQQHQQAYDRALHHLQHHQQHDPRYRGYHQRSPQAQGGNPQQYAPSPYSWRHEGVYDHQHQQQQFRQHKEQYLRQRQKEQQQQQQEARGQDPP